MESGILADDHGMAAITVTNLTHAHYLLTLPPGQFVTLAGLGSVVISEAEWVEGATLRDSINTMLAEGLISTSGVPTGWLKDGVPAQYRLAGSTQSQTVTTDPDSSTVESVFDLGVPGFYEVTFTAVAFDGDGEVFVDGNLGDPGVVCYVHLSWSVSADGESYISPNTLYDDYSQAAPLSGGLAEAGQREVGVIFSPRYVKLAPIILDNSTLGNIYAGSNHPTATVRIDVTRI